MEFPELAGCDDAPFSGGGEEGEAGEDAGLKDTCYDGFVVGGEGGEGLDEGVHAEAGYEDCVVGGKEGF